PASGDAAGRVHLRRGTAARGAVRGEGGRRDRAGADRLRSRGSPQGVRRDSPDAPAHEGFARGPRGRASPHVCPRRGVGAVAIALSGGTVVTSIDPPRLASADLLVEGTRIAAVGLPLASNGAPRLDCSGCLIVPGNVCAHTHLYSAL